MEGSHYELDREQTTRATIGQGSVTVREDAETGNDSTANLNRDTQLAQEITKDKERDIDLYVSSTAIDSVKGLTASGDENTLNQWKDNVESVADPDAWKNVAAQGTQVVVVGAAVAIDEDITVKGINDAIAHRNAIQQSVAVLEAETSTPEQRKDAAEHLVRNRVNWDADNPQAIAMRDDMAESLGQLMLTDPAKAEYALQLFAQVVQESEQPGNNIYSISSKFLPELLAVLGITTMVVTTQTSLDEELARNAARQLGNTDANGLRALEDLRSEQQVFGRNLSDTEIYARLQPGEAYQREDGTVLVRTEDGYEWKTYASNTHTSQYAILTPSELGQSGGYQAYDGDKPTSLTTPVADNLGTNNTQTLPATQDNYVGGYEAADQLPTDTAGGTATPVVPITAMMSEDAYHSPASPNSAGKTQNILDGINPDFLNPDSRFGKAFYIGEDATTVISELSHHGLDSTHAIRYTIDINSANILDLTNPEIAKAWGYSGGSITSETKAIGDRAKAEGFNVIRFNSERNPGGVNHAVLDEFEQILRPEMVVPVKP